MQTLGWIKWVSLRGVGKQGMKGELVSPNMKENLGAATVTPDRTSFKTRVAPNWYPGGTNKNISGSIPSNTTLSSFTKAGNSPPQGRGPGKEKEMVGGEVALGKGACPSSLTWGEGPARGALPTAPSGIAKQEEGLTKMYQTGQYWQTGGAGPLKQKCPKLKGKRLLQRCNVWIVQKP